MSYLHKALVSVLIGVLLLISLGGNLQTVHAQTGIDLVVHYVEGTPNVGQLTYDVSAYFSLLDASGSLIKNLTANDLLVNEDGKKVEIVSLKTAESEPTSVAIVLPNSSSMSGQKIAAARTAANDFINGLKSGDRVAVLSFNTAILPLSDFTTDQTAAHNQVESITASEDSGNCLYDAAYKAVQMTAALPSGRRAIILVTDNRDQAGGGHGGGCSKYTLDDVINLASQGSTRVPIFPIGLGSYADEKNLQRLAGLTGGRYFSSPAAPQLDALFLRLSDQLRLQYVLHYASSTEPGNHALVLQANYQGAQSQDTRKFVLPPFPYSLSFAAPLEGQQISGKTGISISLSGKGVPIKQVVFQANGVSIGTAGTPPYGLDWLPPADLSGEVTLLAIAQDANGAELARAMVKVTLPPPPTEVPTPVPPVATPAPQNNNGKNLTLVGGGVLIILAIIGVVVFAVLRRPRRGKKPGGDKEEKLGLATLPVVMPDRTTDAFEPSANALGILTVLQSDDQAMVGLQIEIVHASTSLGRSTDNDIIFPKDTPVSRRHAIIEERHGQLILSEALAPDKGGQVKRPTYGTFVNDQQVEDPVPLLDGDEIRLGKRVRLRFETIARTGPEGERTVDLLSTLPVVSPDKNQTVDPGT